MSWWCCRDGAEVSWSDAATRRQASGARAGSTGRQAEWQRSRLASSWQPAGAPQINADDLIATSRSSTSRRGAAQHVSRACAGSSASAAAAQAAAAARSPAPLRSPAPAPPGRLTGPRSRPGRRLGWDRRQSPGLAAAACHSPKQAEVGRCQALVVLGQLRERWDGSAAAQAGDGSPHILPCSPAAGPRPLQGA